MEHKMKVIVLTFESGCDECIEYNLDALEYISFLIDQITDMRIYEVEKIAHESTQQIFPNVIEQLDNLSAYKRNQ